MTWQKTGAVHLVGALNDGSVLVNGSTLSRVDLTGSITDFVGGASVSSPTYVAGDRWVGGGEIGGLSMIASPPSISGQNGGTNSMAAARENYDQVLPLDPWWFFSAVEWALANGNEQKQNAPPPCNTVLEFAPLCKRYQEAMDQQWGYLKAPLLNPVSPEYGRIRTFVLDKLGTDYSSPGKLLEYMDAGHTFYSGIHSTVRYCYAFNSFFCNPNPEIYAMFNIDDLNMQALAVRDKRPFEGFFRPVQHPNDPHPSIHNGIHNDVHTRARTFHELLHGWTGRTDDELQALLVPSACQSASSHVITDYLLKYVFLVAEDSSTNPYDPCLGVQ